MGEWVGAVVEVQTQDESDDVQVRLVVLDTQMREVQSSDEVHVSPLEHPPQLPPQSTSVSSPS